MVWYSNPKQENYQEQQKAGVQQKYPPGQIFRSDSISSNSSSVSSSSSIQEQEDSRDENNYYLTATTTRKLIEDNRNNNKLSASSITIPKRIVTSVVKSFNKKNSNNFTSSDNRSCGASKVSFASSPTVVEGCGNDNIISNYNEGLELLKKTMNNKSDDNNINSSNNSVKSSMSRLIFLKKSKSLKKLRSLKKLSKRSFLRSKKSSSAASTTPIANNDTNISDFLNGNYSFNDCGISFLSLKSKISHKSKNTNISHKSKNTTMSHRSYGSGSRASSLVVLPKAPSAKDAAFSGHPRYDWIDIEAAATIKIQAFFRRILVLNELQRKGILTTYMKKRTRNTNREIFMKIFHANKQSSISNNNQFLFSFCSTLDQYMLNSVYSFDKERNKINAEYQENKKLKEIEEATKRKYHHKLKSQSSLQILEEYEVLDFKES